MIDLDAVSRSLAGTREGLAASNYALDCADGGDGRLLVTVRALDGACEECLVPKAIFVDLLRSELGEGGVTPARVDVVYPLDDGA